MIRCLPSSPGKAWVTRIDWMISLSLRSADRWVWATASAEVSSVSSRWRTSCWVIVDAPRALPRMASRPAAMMPTGSNPEFSQNERSSTAVVASTRTGGISSKVTTSRLNSPNRASCTVPVRS